MSFGASLSRIMGSLGPNRSLPERTALFAAAAVVGPTFEPGLQPRRTIHQALATGVVSAATLGAVTVSQSSIESLGRLITRDRTDSGSVVFRTVVNIGVNAVAASACISAARLLPPRPDESLRRGLARTALDRTGRAAVMTTGLAATLGVLDGLSNVSPKLRWMNLIPIALPAGIAVSAVKIRQVHRAAEANGDKTIAQVSTGKSTGLGVAIGVGVIGLQAGERLIAHGVSRSIGKVAPRYEPIAAPIGHLVALAMLGGGFAAGYEYMLRKIEQGGVAIEPAYEVPPTSTSVSGGPGSEVTFESLSREGRRFVNMVLTPAEIESVMGEPALKDPARVFVGLAQSDQLEDRVDAVMDELVRVGAFDRKVLVFASPTGSGYINYVMAEALEYLTRGDSCIATMQYSLLPSFLSLDRAKLGVDQNRALMHAITGYLRGMDPEKRPRFILFGESLGAQTMQDVFAHRTVEALDRDFVHSSLFLGTPAGTKFAASWHVNPERIDPKNELIEVDNFGEYLDLTPEQRASVRHVLLSHYDDPIPKFGPSLLVRQPWWLGPVDQRPPGVPKSTTWRPATTFVLTGVDLTNAMEVIPGDFGRRGHDYREDIPHFVSEIFDLPVTAPQTERMGEALRRRELEWAEKRVVTEQLARAREAVSRELKSWGVTPDSPQGNEMIKSILSGVLNPSN